MAAKLKTGDRVIVISGREKGSTGTISSVDRQRGRAVVSGLNIATVHQKQNTTSGQQSGKIAKEAPMDLSNLMLMDPQNNVGTRVGFRVENGKKVRFAKHSGSVIDG